MSNYNWYDRYMPQGHLQLALTSLGATALAYFLLRSLLRKRQDMRDKVVLITGASSGIGKALAQEFVQAGSRVILAARSIDKLEEVKQSLLAHNKVPVDSISTFYLDLDDHGSIAQASSSLIQVYGRIDILINNAGVGCRSQVVDMDLNTYKKLMDVNFFGQVELTKAILPLMIKQGGGSIVAVSSLQGRFAIPRGSAYGASKHALQAFCDSLRAETSSKNIHVLVVSPSYVKTNIALSTLSGAGEKSGAQRPEIEKGMSSESCARQIIQAVRSYQTDVLIGPMHHKLMVYIRALCPSLYNYITSRL